jgi:hypothetical protein
VVIESAARTAQPLPCIPTIAVIIALLLSWINNSTTYKKRWDV